MGSDADQEGQVHHRRHRRRQVDDEKVLLSIGANKSKGYPEAFFFTGTVVTACRHRFLHEAYSVMKNIINQYLSLIR